MTFTCCIVVVQVCMNDVAQVAVVQNIEITLINGHYSMRVSSLETREGCPITPGVSLAKTFALVPTLNGNTDVRGIALDGYLKV